MRSLLKEAQAFRSDIVPLRDDMDALREAFAGADAELEALRKALTPEVEGLHAAADRIGERVGHIRALIEALDSDIKEMGVEVTGEMAAFHRTIQVLVREADEMRQVVEPLQGASERVGRVADKLPGGG